METKLLGRIRILLIIFMAALVLCGVSIFPLKQQIDLVAGAFGSGTLTDRIFPPMAQWIEQLHEGITHVHTNYPFLFYCTDWVGFAMIVIALVFVGPIRDPVRNIWVIQFGILTCLLTIPAIVICGTIRRFPPFWFVVDSLFAIGGLVLLYPAFRWARRLEQLKT